MTDDLLDRIGRNLALQGAHTILLYGSRADGSANAHSDYDVAAFAPVDRTRRDTRVVDDCFLDVLRSRRGDVEGDYRRAWLLTALLDDDFVTRGRGFEGPKKSLQWLRVNVPALHRAFEVALRPGASVESIDELVDLATGRRR